VRWEEAGVDITKFQAIPSENNPKPYYCIIPLFGAAKAEVAPLPWPRLSQPSFEALQPPIAERFDGVAPRLVAQNVKGFLGFLLGLPLKPVIRNLPGLMRDKALTFISFTILADLVRRDQIEGWDLPGVWRLPIDVGNGTPLDGNDIRLVLAELLNPAHNGLSTAKSLATATALDVVQVEKALDLCRGPEAMGTPFNLKRAIWEHKGNPCKTCESFMEGRDKPFKVWMAPWTEKPTGTNKDGAPLYSLASRKPRYTSAPDGSVGTGCAAAKRFFRGGCTSNNVLAPAAQNPRVTPHSNR